jgi:hypothetical protein
VARDFCIPAYGELLAAIRGTGWKVYTLEEYFRERRLPPDFFILRHDVDRRPGRALRMAALEKAHGIRSTYYFRKHLFDRSTLERISTLGHELGYHYEVMDRAKGSFLLANYLFTNELAAMRAMVDVKTVAMHGNPLSRWDNRELWRLHEPWDFGLAGEAYISIRDPEIYYVTDTGGGWNRVRDNVFDRLPSGGPSRMPPFQSTHGLIDAIETCRFRKVYLQVHPNRWTEGAMEGALQGIEDLVLNLLKKILRRGRGRIPVR